MRLLVDARLGWGHGIGRVIAGVVPRLAALRPDWRIDALVLPADMTRAGAALGGAPNLALRPVPVAPFSLAEQTRLPGLARDYDLSWFTNYWVPLAWRGRFVATVHDMLHLLPELLPAGAARRAAARATFAKVRRDACAVTFVSRFTEREFRRLVGDPRVGVTVPNGADHLVATPAPPPLRGRTRRLLVVAAAKRHKNFAVLIAAWRAARVADDWTLTIVSPGEALISTVDVDALAGGDPRIDLRRGVGDDALARLYADSAVLLMPSLYEGFGLPLVEGMRAGALCVSAAAGAMVEVATGGFVQFVNGPDQVGWTAAIETACALVEEDAGALAPLVARNSACAARYRWDATARGIADVLAAAA